MELLKHHFRRKLVALGYPDDLEVECSLGYCQGDAVAFFGDIDTDSLKRLMHRLGDKFEQK